MHLPSEGVLHFITGAITKSGIYIFCIFFIPIGAHEEKTGLSFLSVLLLGPAVLAAIKHISAL